MKTTKQQLRQIIKEELEVVLTNEEAGELFGEGVEAELEEFLKFDFFPRVGGGIGVTRIISAMDRVKTKLAA